MQKRFISGTTRRGNKGLDRRDLLHLLIAAGLVLAGGVTWRFSHTETVLQADMTLWSQQTLQILGPLAL